MADARGVLELQKVSNPTRGIFEDGPDISVAFRFGKSITLGIAVIEVTGLRFFARVVEGNIGKIGMNPWACCVFFPFFPVFPELLRRENVAPAQGYLLANGFTWKVRSRVPGFVATPVGLSIRFRAYKFSSAFFTSAAFIACRMLKVSSPLVNVSRPSIQRQQRSACCSASSSPAT
jgi:hypothetical protein